MGNVSGTPVRVAIDGVSYDVSADTNITLNLSPIEREGVPTSGRTMFKVTRRTPTAEGIPISATPSEQVDLRDTADRLEDYPLFIELADGSIYRSTGQINFDNVETEENRATIMMIPNNSRAAWELFG